MFILNELRDSIDAIAARIGDVEPDALAAAMRGLDGEAMLQLMAEASVLANRTERLLTVGAGVIKMIQSNGVSINKDKVTDINAEIGQADIMDGKYILAQKGKKNYFIINII